MRKCSSHKRHGLVLCFAHFSALGSNQSSSHLSQTGAQLLLSTARLPQLHGNTGYSFVGSLRRNYHLMKSQVCSHVCLLYVFIINNCFLLQQRQVITSCYPDIVIVLMFTCQQDDRKSTDPVFAGHNVGMGHGSGKSPLNFGPNWDNGGLVIDFFLITLVYVV